MNQFITFEPAIEISHPRLVALGNRIDDCRGSEEYLPVIRKIARTKHPEAIEVLAALLDSPGAVGDAAAEALARFGQVAVPALERVRDASMDAHARHHADEALRLIAVERARRHAPPLFKAA